MVPRTCISNAAVVQKLKGTLRHSQMQLKNAMHGSIWRACLFSMTLDDLEGLGNVMARCHLPEEGLLEQRLSHFHCLNCSVEDRLSAVRPERTPETCRSVVTTRGYKMG